MRVGLTSLTMLMAAPAGQLPIFNDGNHVALPHGHMLDYMRIQRLHPQRGQRSLASLDAQLVAVICSARVQLTISCTQSTAACVFQLTFSFTCSAGIAPALSDSHELC